MRDTGLIVIYRWLVPTDQESAFIAQWQALTEQLTKRGGLGSCLSRDGDGRFVAIAAWPDPACRKAAFADMPTSAVLPGVERLAETVLDVERDLWVCSPFRS